MTNFEKYTALAKQLKMIDAKLISPKDIVFDIRSVLKCRWGCEGYSETNEKCSARDLSYQDRIEMIKKYKTILLVHANNSRDISKAVLEIEKTAFLDGYYFAFALRTCNICKVCAVERGKPCPTPEKIRPCEQVFGIDMYKTARNLGLPIDVLQSKDDVQNRYGFVLID